MLKLENTTMQVKKIGIGIIALLLVFYVFIWCKYDWMYEEYNPQKVEQLFEAKKMRAPIYDTLVINKFKIGYLSNKRYNYVEGYDYLGGIRNPYLILIPENGASVASLLPYFMDEELNKKFHVIAIDRIGFGGSKVEKNEEGQPFGHYDNRASFEENALYTLLMMPKYIAKSEGNYLDEVRVVFSGKTAVTGLGTAYDMSMTSEKIFLLNADLEERFFWTIGYSRFVLSGIGRLIFPENYVSKHQDLCVADQAKTKYMKHWVESVKYAEDEENQNEYSMYKGASQGKKAKWLFFAGLGVSDKKKVDALTGGDNFVFYEETVELSNIEQVLELLRKADFYTLEFNQLSKSRYINADKE
ncbi:MULTISPECIES: hypothetical protein [unclassified Myroides]|uniref:alpha/beta fold hydrolase n=1 Tax=unclassified Myroides TaxID=2642485 RepID=UPI002578FEA3|nr:MULTISPECIES: hypothetical protein [unclassified Myroides]